MSENSFLRDLLGKEEWKNFINPVKSELRIGLERDGWEFQSNYPSGMIGGEDLRSYYKRCHQKHDVLLAPAFNIRGEPLPSPMVAVYIR